MKKLIILTILILSCNTQKQLQRAINKNGQKESIEYIVKKYPEYFNNFAVKDTISALLKDTVFLKEVVMDTTFVVETDGTFVAENESLKLELTKLNNKLKAKVKGKPKEIIVEKEIKVPVEIEKPCPDLQIFQDEIVKLKYEEKAQKKAFRISLFFNILLFLLLGFIFYREYIKK